MGLWEESFSRIRSFGGGRDEAECGLVFLLGPAHRVIITSLKLSSCAFRILLSYVEPPYRL